MPPQHVTVDIVQKACHYVALLRHPDLRKETPTISSELSEAATIVRDHYEEFVSLVDQRLAELPLIQKFYGKLVSRRLAQNGGVLASPIISAIFDHDRGLEQRLSRVQHVPGIHYVFAEAGVSENLDQGENTDRVIQDITAEVLILDFLLQLGFTDVEKLGPSKNRPRPDIVAIREHKSYAIEVTRKQEVTDWEIANDGAGESGLENCKSLVNQIGIRRLVEDVLGKKSNQFSRAFAAGTVAAETIRVVALKTSDYGFVECIRETAQIGADLLSQPHAWDGIDCLWFVPNIAVADSQWICRA